VTLAARRALVRAQSVSCRIEGAHPLPARTVIIATGAEYRKLCSKTCNDSRDGVLRATFLEAQLCGDEEVIIVGGAMPLVKRLYFCRRQRNMSTQ
jgi:hypothetical protein